MLAGKSRLIKDGDCPPRSLWVEQLHRLHLAPPSAPLSGASVRLTSRTPDCLHDSSRSTRFFLPLPTRPIPHPPQHIFELLSPFYPPSTTFSLSSSGQISASQQRTDGFPLRYLYKSALPPDTQLIDEAESLARMNTASAGVAPKLLGRGEDGDGRR